jgi:DNA-binding beta-propeller fold protein YncE
VRKIQDSYSAFSSVAVDPINNEVVVTDENLFNVLVYDRMTNTPPQATMSEPKRKIGGLRTKMEFQCGLYIDPTNGDIYAVSNDDIDQMVVFSRAATGNVPPKRYLHTPRGTFGIAVDEAHQEMLLTIQHDSAVVTFHKLAEGHDAPTRLLQGDRTLLADPHGIALDTKNDLIFVANHGSAHSVQATDEQRDREGGTSARGQGKKNWPIGTNFAVPGSGRFLDSSITVYPRSAEGDTAPLRVISGPKTRLNWPTGLAYDPRTDEIFVGNDMGDEVLVFSATANGDVAPVRILKGPKTKIKYPTGVFVDTTNDELWVSNFGNHTATVYKASASGDTPPLRMIRSAPEQVPTLVIGNSRVAYDTKREEILVPN